jgi:hypothetical protein
VASPDLRQYARNLRRVGCPEQTIRDIILAEVNRAYGVQERALKVRPDDVAPWEKAGVYNRHSAESKLRQLLEEKRALLKELTGVDVGIDMPPRLAGRDLQKFEGAFAAIGSDKQDQARGIMEKYWAQSDEIKQRTVGYLEPEDRDEFLRIKTERRDALSQALTPAELQDFEMKTSEITPNLKNRLEGVKVSDSEFAQIFNYMVPLEDQYSLTRRNPDPVDPEFTAARTQAEKDVEAEIHTTLGDDRYAQYERNRDPVYRAINQAASDSGASPDTINQAYDAQKQLQDAAQRVLQDASLSQDQRAQSLNQIRAQAQQALQQLFGDKAGQIVQRLPQFQMADRYGLTAPVVAPVPAAPANIIVKP